jgi:hypothetical protein
LVLTSVILTIIVLNFHFRGPKKQRVPYFIRRYFIGSFGRVFCFCYESRLFEKEQKKLVKYHESNIHGTTCDKKFNVTYSPVTANPLNTKKTSSSSLYVNDVNDDDGEINSFGDIYRNSQTIVPHINNTNNNDNYIIHYASSSHLNINPLIRSIPSSLNASFADQFEATEADELRASFRISSQPDLNNNNLNKNNKKQRKLNNVKTSKRDTNTNTNFNREVSKNLEKMLIKMQRSFDPYKLEDENLKFAILKEILECQRLLLTANIKINDTASLTTDKNSNDNKNKPREPTLQEIYDEWKTLAMIVDRMCFCVYLSAITISSIYFIYNA